MRCVTLSADSNTCSAITLLVHLQWIDSGQQKVNKPNASLSSIVDGASGTDNIANLFASKFGALPSTLHLATLFSTPFNVRLTPSLYSY